MMLWMWLQHVFMHKDRAAHRMEQLQSALENAVQGEMYEDAAEYSADLARHAEWDDVDKILDVRPLLSPMSLLHVKGCPDMQHLRMHLIVGSW